MRNVFLHKHYGKLFIISLFTIYIVRRLISEVYEYERLIALSQGSSKLALIRAKSLSNYNYLLNNNIPLIAEIFLFLMAWYIFHNQTYPRLIYNLNSSKVWLSGSLVILLLIAAAFIYNYLKVRVYGVYHTGSYKDFGFTLHKYLIGRLTKSKNLDYIYVLDYYRKKIVMFDAIGLGIILILFELVTQYYQYFIQIIKAKPNQLLKLISYFQIFTIVAFFILVSVKVDLGDPQPFWRNFSDDSYLGHLGLFSLREYLPIVWYSVLFIYFLIFFHRILGSNIPYFQTRLRIFSAFVNLSLAFLGSYLVLKSYIFYSHKNSYSNGRFIELISLSTFQVSFFLTLFILLLAFVCAIIPWSRSYVRQVQVLISQATKALQARLSKKEAELDSLRAQINPHFLYNSLNSLYALALQGNSEKTADGIQKLGDMMQFMLEDNQLEQISLSKEITYLRNYIQFQRMRIDESNDIDIQITIEEPDREIFIAPMMLQPFIENAFKHGISLQNSSWIYIILTIDAKSLSLKVQNSLHSKRVKESKLNRSGIGLENVRKRLELLYPEKHRLIIQKSESEYIATLTLTLSK